MALFGIIMGFWLLHSGWAFNGWNWGPRFLVPIIPALMIPIGLLNKRWRMPLIGLVFLGFLVNAPTFVAFYQRYYAEIADSDIKLASVLVLWHDQPAMTPLFNIWGSTYNQLQAAFSTPVQDIIANAGTPPPPDNFTQAELLRIVAVWWWFLPAAGIPLWVGVAIATTLVGSGIWFLKSGWRTSNQSPNPQPLNETPPAEPIP